MQRQQPKLHWPKPKQLQPKLLNTHQIPILQVTMLQLRQYKVMLLQVRPHQVTLQELSADIFG